ncbi:MAG: hypothetical protein ACPG4Z_02150, partial [Chitinophagales bacterium]
MDTKTLQELVNIDSPSGYTKDACNYISKTLNSYGYQPQLTAKGAVTCNLGENPKLVLAAHTDTLGGIVSKINADGSVRISNVGGPLLPSYEGCYVRIHTLAEKIYTGTFLLDNPAVHVNRNAASTTR